MTVSLDNLQWYLAVVVVVTVVVAYGILFLRTSVVSWARLLLTAIWIALVFLAGSVPMPDFFGAMHVMYALLTWAVPLIGAGLLASRWVLPARRRARFMGLAGLLALMPGAVGFYATNIEPDRLMVEHHKIANKRLTDLKIVVVSDIQSPRVTAYERNVVATVNQQRPDVILFPGDLYSGENDPFPTHLKEFRDLISGFRSTYGTYMVPGDHDDHNLRSIVAGTPVHLLQNDSSVLVVGGRRLGILGLENAYFSADAKGQVNAFAERDDLDYRIVISHHPDVVYDLDPRIDLVVAGHTHGGQVRIPGYGAILSLSTMPPDIAGGGLFTIEGRPRLLLTRGAGYQHGYAPKIRLFCPPSIEVLTF